MQSATFPPAPTPPKQRRARLAVGAAALAALGACTPMPPDGAINDPYESTNRSVHEFNRGFDRTLARPASQAYGTVVPAPVREMVDNFANNLELPGDVLNNILQGRPGPALRNTARFAFNTVLGFGGLVDPAQLIGLNHDKTDFGETLAVWGVREGAYVELPVLGPSTERDTLGKVVDFAMNPVGWVADHRRDNQIAAVGVAAALGDRYTFTGVIDDILYNSADSYAQLRLQYLQNRRFELGQGADEPVIDPYEDLYGQ